jgi:hypothetical protein
LIKKYLDKDEKILIEVQVGSGAMTPFQWGRWDDYFYYATDKRLLCLKHTSYYQEPEQEQLYELPYSSLTIKRFEKRKIEWIWILSGVIIAWIFSTLNLLFSFLGVLLIASGFLLRKDSWYQIDSPSMTESERRIWQIPTDVLNADKFYAVVSDKVGRMG